MAKKKSYDIYLTIGEDKRPYLKIEVDGRVYSQPVRPNIPTNEQCLELVEKVENAEEFLMMCQCDTFEEFMFKKLKGE